MSNLHSKLNWEAFQKVRARRKRRRLLWWFFLMPTTACIAGLLVFQLGGLSNEANEKAAKATAEASSEKMPTAASADAGNPKSMPEKNSGLQNMTEQPTDPGNNSVTTPKLNAAVPEKAVSAAPKTGFPAQASAFIQSTTATSAKRLPKVSTVLAEKAATATPVLDAQEVVDPFEKMKLLKLQSLKREPLALPGAIILEPAEVSPIPNKDFKKKKAPAKYPIWLSLAWSPWHSSEFLIPQLDAITELNYRALNSAQAVLRIQLTTFPKGTVSIEPQFSEQRFQTQFNGQFSDIIYAPGSIVGYLQTVKGIEPVISDSVPGISGLGLRENGLQREFSLPIMVDYMLYKKGYFQLTTASSLGLHYRARYQGVWYDGVQLVSLDEAPGLLGMMAAGSLALNFQPGRINYYCSWTSTYRSTVRADQPGLRNQVWIGMRLSISDF